MEHAYEPLLPSERDNEYLALQEISREIMREFVSQFSLPAHLLAGVENYVAARTTNAPLEKLFGKMKQSMTQSLSEIAE